MKPKFKIGQKVTDADSRHSCLYDYVKEIYIIKYKKNSKIETRIEYMCGFGKNHLEWNLYPESDLKLY